MTTYEVPGIPFCNPELRVVDAAEADTSVGAAAPEITVDPVKISSRSMNDVS